MSESQCEIDILVTIADLEGLKLANGLHIHGSYYGLKELRDRIDQALSGAEAQTENKICKHCGFITQKPCWHKRQTTECANYSKSPAVPPPPTADEI